MGMKQSVGLKAIAANCNVSVNTISRALRDCPDISESTKQKIRAEAISLGYVVNRIAISLKSGSTKTIALIFNNLNSPYFAQMTNRLMALMKKENYNAIILPNFSSTCTKDDIQECLLIRVDAVITFLEPDKDAAMIAKLNRLPIVLVGRQTPYEGIDMVYTDDVKGGRLAAEYLISKGAKNLAYISADELECSHRRLKGFKQGAQELNKNIKINVINEKALENNLANLSFDPLTIDGIFGFNDQLTLDLISALLRKNHEIKVSAVGFDGLSPYFQHNQIASISYDLNEIANKVFELAMERISSNSEPSLYKKVMYDVFLKLGTI